MREGGRKGERGGKEGERKGVKERSIKELPFYGCVGVVWLLLW